MGIDLRTQKRQFGFPESYLSTVMHRLIVPTILGKEVHYAKREENDGKVQVVPQVVAPTHRRIIIVGPKQLVKDHLLQQRP